MTWELILVIAALLLQTTDYRVTAVTRIAGLDLSCQWDSYLRPSELLELTRGEVIIDRALKGGVAVIARAAPDDWEG